MVQVVSIRWKKASVKRRFSGLDTTLTQFAIGAASEQDDAVVTFYFGPLGGWTDVTEISISTAKALSWRLASCKRSPLVLRNLTFLRGLML